MIAHDKGKPVVRQGRKAMSLQFFEVEIVRLPKAIEYGTWIPSPDWQIRL